MMTSCISRNRPAGPRKFGEIHYEMASEIAFLALKCLRNSKIFAPAARNMRNLGFNDLLKRFLFKNEFGDQPDFGLSQKFFDIYII